jgi:DNA repair photolyase
MEKNMPRRTTGASEWAQKRLNIIRGCTHDCLYCWAKGLAVRRHQCLPEDWAQEVFNKRNWKAAIRPKVHSLMFPSTHDITPQFLPQHLEFLGKLLVAYPSVLVVSKPHLDCTRAICQQFPQYRDKLMFRFTWGSADDAVLKFWEPNATGSTERLACLQHAFEQGYKTSLSCEPMLDRNIAEVVRIATPFITDTIWLGKANELKEYLVLNGHDTPEVMARADELIGWQSDENIRSLYQQFRDNPLIRWKDSIQAVVGLDGPVAK